MRLAVLSDIHGNSVALDAVLADIASQGGVDAYWVLGDLVAFGPDPAGVLERLALLKNASYVHGNTDRDLTETDLNLPPLEELAANPDLFSRLIQIIQNFAWTIGALHHTDWHETLSAFPLEQRLVLPDGTRVLGVHAAPGTDTGSGIHPRLSESELRELLAPAQADLIFVGHTHWAMDATVDSVRVVNLGSVSMASLPDVRAKYTLVRSDANGYTLEHRRVDYDRAAVMASVQASHNPAAEFILRALRGENRPPWSKNISAADAERLGLPAEWAAS